MAQDFFNELFSAGGMVTLAKAITGLSISAYCHNHIITVARVAGHTGIEPTRLNKKRAREVDSVLQSWSRYMPVLTRMQDRAELSAELDSLRAKLPSDVQHALDDTLQPYAIPSIAPDSTLAEMGVHAQDLRRRVSRFYAEPTVIDYLTR